MFTLLPGRRASHGILTLAAQASKHDRDPPVENAACRRADEPGSDRAEPAGRELARRRAPGGRPPREASATADAIPARASVRMLERSSSTLRHELARGSRTGGGRDGGAAVAGR